MDLKIIYRPGDENAIANALSGLKSPTCQGAESSFRGKGGGEKLTGWGCEEERREMAKNPWNSPDIT